MVWVMILSREQLEYIHAHPEKTWKQLSQEIGVHRSWIELAWEFYQQFESPEKVKID